MVGKVKIMRVGGWDPNGPNKVRQCTQLLLSGSHWNIETFMGERPTDFQGCGLMLSYFACRKPSEDRRRMKRLFTKGTKQ